MSAQDHKACRELLTILRRAGGHWLAYTDHLEAILGLTYPIVPGGLIWAPKMSEKREMLRALCRRVELGEENAFIVPKADMPALTARQIVHDQQKRLGRRFATRQMSTGLKVWRTA